MQLPHSKELDHVIAESRDVAMRLDQSLTSAHLLLCLFTLKNRASMFLSDHRVTAERLLDALAKRPREDAETWPRILRRAQDVASVSGASHVSSLHTLVALCSFVDSAAYQLIAALDLDMSTVRNTALAFLQSEGPDAPPASVVAPTNKRAGAEARTEEPPSPAAARSRLSRPASPATPPAPTARSLASRVFGATPHRPAPRAEQPELPRVRPSSDLPLPPSVRRRRPQDARDARPRTVGRHQLILREKAFPVLSQFGRNLSLLAFDGDIDPVVGRDREMDQLVDILNKRRSNNPVLVGEAGVGKTTVVEGLARRVVGADGESAPPGLEGRILVELEATKLIAGTGVRGSFSERIQALKNEVARANGSVILFLDELHQWIGMGAGGDGAADGAGELKTALARGEFPCIGATTYDEYRKFIESDPAFARRFQTVRVDEPTPDRAIEILDGVRATYAAHHDVTFEDEAIRAAVRLTHRYLPERRLPDKAIGVLDLAGSRARRIGATSVGRPLIATIVGELAGLSADKLLMADRERFLDLEQQLMQHVVGHRTVVERVAHMLRRNYAGFVSGRPIGSFLFLGTTGVGKTEFAKALTRVLFEDDGAMVRVDMSEYMEAHAVARLIGSPPGYVGHDAGGQLTEAVRQRPYQVVLLDEIEKAHPDVLNLLIQLLDEGHLTDARGRTVDFSNTVVIMTSNLGADALVGGSPRRLGFGTAGAETASTTRDTDRVLDAARPHFRPELWNRFDEALVFAPLSEDDVARIARLQLTRSSQRLLEERGISFTCEPAVIDLLIDSGGYDREMGARPMRRTIERLVEGPIAERILRGEVEGPAELEVVVENGAIVVRTVASE